VRPGNRKKHGLFGAAANEPDQKSGETFKKNSLTDNE